MSNSIRRLGAWLFGQPYLLLIITTLFWAGNAIVGRGVRGDVEPIALAFLRWCGAFAITLPFALPHMRRDWSVILRRWRILLVLSALGVGTFNTLLYTGLQFTTATNAALIQSANPVLIALSVLVLYREVPSALQIVGIAISLAGVITVITQGDAAILRNLSFNIGDVWCLVAVLVWAAYTALLRKRPPIHWLSFLSVTFGVGVLCLMPLFLLELTGGMRINPTPSAVAAIVYVAIFPSVIAYICFNRGVELIGPTRAGPFNHLVPLFVAILAFALLGETPHLYHAIGFALVIGGVTMASQKRS